MKDNNVVRGFFSIVLLVLLMYTSYLWGIRTEKTDNTVYHHVYYEYNILDCVISPIDTVEFDSDVKSVSEYDSRKILNANINPTKKEIAYKKFKDCIVDQGDWGCDSCYRLYIDSTYEGY